MARGPRWSGYYPHQCLAEVAQPQCSSGNERRRGCCVARFPEDDRRAKLRDPSDLKERLKKLQDFIVKQVSNRKSLKAYTERIRSLVGVLTSVRPIDRMKWLADHGGADTTHINAWRKLRNRSVHPATKGDVDVASLDFQKMIDELHCVTVPI